MTHLRLKTVKGVEMCIFRIVCPCNSITALFEKILVDFRC